MFGRGFGHPSFFTPFLGLGSNWGQTGVKSRVKKRGILGVSAPRLRVKNVLSCGLFEVSFAPYYGVGARVATGGTQQRGLKTSVLGRF